MKVMEEILPVSYIQEPGKEHAMARFDGKSRIQTLKIKSNRVGRIKVESAEPTAAWKIERAVDGHIKSIATLLAVGMGIAVTAAIAHR